MVRWRMTVNAFWLGATDTEAGIVSTVAGATETSSREEGAHSSSGKGEARSAGSGAALGWEAPCCPYSPLSRHSKAPCPGLPHKLQKCLIPSLRRGHGSSHLPLLYFLHAFFFLASQSL